MPDRPSRALARRVAHCVPTLPLAHQLRQAEVGDLHPALLVEQDVLRLDVAVDDAVVVGVLQGLADLRHDGQGLARRELAGVQQPPQVHAVDEFHEEVVEGARDGGRGLGLRRDWPSPGVTSDSAGHCPPPPLTTSVWPKS